MDSIKCLNILTSVGIIIFSVIAILVSIMQKLHPSMITSISILAIVIGIISIIKTINSNKLLKQ